MIKEIGGRKITGAENRRTPGRQRRASLAEDHAAHLIAEPSGFLGIGRGAETFGKVEELLLLALPGLQAVLDQLNQHRVGAQPAGFRQAHALPYDLICRPHATIMDHVGATAEEQKKAPCNLISADGSGRAPSFRRTGIGNRGHWRARRAATAPQSSLTAPAASRARAAACARRAARCCPPAPPASPRAAVQI